MDAFILLITAAGGGSLVAIIQAIANRRAVGATAQKDLASGYGQFTGDLRLELKDRDEKIDKLETKFNALKDRDDLLYWFATDMLRHIGNVHQLCAQGCTPRGPLPPPPPVPAGLSFPNFP